MVLKQQQILTVKKQEEKGFHLDETFFLLIQEVSRRPCV